MADTSGRSGQAASLPRLIPIWDSRRRRSRHRSQAWLVLRLYPPLLRHERLEDTSYIASPHGPFGTLSNLVSAAYDEAFARAA